MTLLPLPMMSDLESKMTLPVNLRVIVCDVRENGQLWPVGQIDLRTDDHAVITSGKKNAALLIAPLEKAHAAAVRHAAALAAQQTIDNLNRSTAAA
jgi:hypothetical protein